MSNTCRPLNRLARHLCRAVWLLVVWASLGQGHAAPPSPPTGVRASWSTPTVALGEPVDLVLTWTPQSRRPRPAPGTAPGHPLADWWTAAGGDALLHDGFDTVQRTQGQSGPTWDLRLTLHPRQSGHWRPTGVLAALQLPPLEVSDGSAQTPAVQWRWRQWPAQGAERQARLVVLEACHPGALRWTTPVWPVRSGLQMAAVPARAAGEPTCPGERWAWRVTPTAPGAHRLEPGWVQALAFGRPLRFPAPGLTLQAEPLPAWLPQGLAAGPTRVLWEPPEHPVVAGQPATWRLAVGHGPSPVFVLAHITDAWAHGEPGAGPGWLRWPLQWQAATAEQPDVQGWVVVTAVPGRAGPWAPPALQWPWWDAGPRALRWTRLVAPPVDVSPAPPGWWHRGLLLAAAAAALGVWAWPRRLLWRHRWRRNRWRHAVQHAHSLATLDRLLNGWLAHEQQAPAAVQAEAQALVAQSLLPVWAALQSARFGQTLGPETLNAHTLRLLRHRLMWA
jgi:hypothetical protein